MVSTYSAGSSAAGEWLASEARSGGSVGSRPVAIIEAENPWGSCLPGLWKRVPQAGERGTCYSRSGGSAR